MTSPTIDHHFKQLIFEINKMREEMAMMRSNLFRIANSLEDKKVLDDEGE